MGLLGITWQRGGKKKRSIREGFSGAGWWGGGGERERGEQEPRSRHPPVRSSSETLDENSAITDQRRVSALRPRSRDTSGSRDTSLRISARPSRSGRSINSIFSNNCTAATGEDERSKSRFASEIESPRVGSQSTASISK